MSLREQSQANMRPRASSPPSASSVNGRAVALAVGRRTAPELAGAADVRLESEPLQVLQRGGFVLGPASAPIVVLHPQQHATAERPGDAPDVDRVGDVTQVQVSGGAGRETGERSRGKARGEGDEIE